MHALHTMMFEQSLPGRALVAAAIIAATVIGGCTLLWSFAAVADPMDLMSATPQSYLERAQQYRLAGDARREQLELNKALHIWPNSEPLRYAYALHQVRRKNLTQAIVHTTYTLELNPDQPTTANLHMQILAQLKRHRESANWIRALLLANQAKPPLVSWQPEWIGRWRTPLQLGRKHAQIAGDENTLTLIDHALARPTAAGRKP